MDERSVGLTEREAGLIEFLRRDENRAQAVTASWALLRYAIDLDQEAARLERLEGMVFQKVISDLKRKSRGLKELSQLVGGV